MIRKRREGKIHAYDVRIIWRGRSIVGRSNQDQCHGKYWSSLILNPGLLLKNLLQPFCSSAVSSPQAMKVVLFLDSSFNKYFSILWDIFCSALESHLTTHSLTHETFESTVVTSVQGDPSNHMNRTWHNMMTCWKESLQNKLARLGDAIAISKSETINDPLTDRGNC